ncbi:C40 family peptidase [Kitasatospora indigofera]|uniref:C40 family peptidase n=1 Tax=Kitasatospora indigofera TaxID=67307 RepID=UPI00362A4796
MKKAVAGLGAVVLLAPFLVILPIAVVSANKAATACAPGASGSPQTVDSVAVEAAVKLILGGSAGPTVPVEGLDLPSTQIPMAKAIVTTGIALGVAPRGQVVALATAMQESRLRNLAYGDRDSLGLFQQRPSQGWGTPEQLQDPVYASTAFYRELLKVPGWQELPVTVAAQKVQKSGFPDAYAQWEPLASALQQALSKVLGAPAPGTPAPSAPASCAPPDGGGSWGVIPPGTLPAGYQIPADVSPAVQSAIRWALGQLNTPYQWGGSCVDSHGPDPMGRCDCSSLMQGAYRAAGIAISRTTYTQVAEGTAVPLDQLRPGDLLFTHPGDNGPEHVGMFIGSGLVVHAPHTGDVVRIAPFAEWKSDVIAARRIVP